LFAGGGEFSGDEHPLSKITASNTELWCQVSESSVTSNARSKTSFVADSLAVGMMVMLTMAVIQRALGLARSVWFCRVLDDSVVGQFAMANDFISMVTPIMLLGMPGSLPRYVEYYRQHGHLTSFVRRLLMVTVVLGIAFITGILLLPKQFGWLVYNDINNPSLVYSLAAGVWGIIVFNFVYQLVSSLRQVRVASTMLFVQSVAFTIIGVSYMVHGGGIVGLVYSFVIATLLGVLPGVWSLMQGWKGLPTTDDSFDATAMWRRILPFAIALWSMNVLTNVFELSDRYMILHLLPGDVDSQAAIGQYHSSRIIPTLLVSLASMVAGLLMPYLSADWEAGRQEQVRQTLRRTLFGVSALATVFGAVSMLFSPWFFQELLQNRYADGLALQPIVFVFSIWMCLAAIGQNYLWAAEKGKWVAVAIGVGLLFNWLLNLLLLPNLGLRGAVMATLLSNGIVLLGLWFAMSRNGYKLDHTTFYLTILPCTLLSNAWVALACVIVPCIANPQLKTWCLEAIDYGRQKVAAALGSVLPS
jgi:polysaccharide transporter, PST family